MSFNGSSNKHYVMAKCSMFTRKQNLEVLKFLQEIGVQICESADGSRINLDKLSKRQLTRFKKKIKELDVPIETKFRID